MRFIRHAAILLLALVA